MRDNTLIHVGVLGMRWGHRKGRSGSSGGKSVGTKAKEWLKEAGKLTKSGITNPYLTDRANSASIRSDTLGNRVRRSTLYQKTKEIKDINKRIEAMKSQNAAARKILQGNKSKPSGIAGYKTSEDHAKDLVASWKAKDMGEVTRDLAKGGSKAAAEFAVGFTAVYGTIVVLQKLSGG